MIHQFQSIEPIRYAQSKGVQFAIATGRDYSSLKGILGAHDLKCFSILGNGAQFTMKMEKFYQVHIFLKNVLNKFYKYLMN